MVLPNFLIIGTAKSGTNTLRNLLMQHSEIGLAKEPNYFASEDVFFDNNLEWYKGKFEAYKNCKMIGEKSWRYSCKSTYPCARDRIINTLGKNIKLVYIVRHPYERLESLWLEAISGGLQDYATLDFNDSLIKNPLFMDSSKYYSQINHYLDIFPETSIKIVFFEDLKSKPQVVMNDLFNFLQVNPIEVNISKNNQSQGKFMETSTSLIIRKIPGNNFIKDMLPKSLRNILKQKLKKSITERPKWNIFSQELVEKELSIDIQKFLEYSGKEADFWNLNTFFTSVN